MRTYNYSTPQSPDELKHYGVLGMKWGIRRARRKQAKAAYKKAVDKAYSKIDREINSIEKNYKRGQNLSDSDARRENKAYSDYEQAVKKAKADYKTAKKDKSHDAAIANKLYSKQNSETNKRVAEASMGKTIAQSLLLGSYGALAYNDARRQGRGRGTAAIQGCLIEMGDTLLYKLPSTASYLDNRFARKKTS